MDGRGSRSFSGRLGLVPIPDLDRDVVADAQPLAAAGVARRRCAPIARRPLAALPRPREVRLGVAAQPAAEDRLQGVALRAGGRSRRDRGSRSRASPARRRCSGGRARPRDRRARRRPRRPRDDPREQAHADAVRSARRGRRRRGGTAHRIAVARLEVASGDPPAHGIRSAVTIQATRAAPSLPAVTSVRPRSVSGEAAAAAGSWIWASTAASSRGARRLASRWAPGRACPGAGRYVSIALPWKLVGGRRAVRQDLQPGVARARRPGGREAHLHRAELPRRERHPVAAVARDGELVGLRAGQLRGPEGQVAAARFLTVILRPLLRLPTARSPKSSGRRGRADRRRGGGVAGDRALEGRHRVAGHLVASSACRRRCSARSGCAGCTTRRELSVVPVQWSRSAGIRYWPAYSPVSAIVPSVTSPWPMFLTLHVRSAERGRPGRCRSRPARSGEPGLRRRSARRR